MGWILFVVALVIGIQLDRAVKRKQKQHEEIVQAINNINNINFEE